MHFLGALSDLQSKWVDRCESSLTQSEGTACVLSGALEVMPVRGLRGNMKKSNLNAKQDLSTSLH
jgi:hypothetical protein